MAVHGLHFPESETDSAANKRTGGKDLNSRTDGLTLGRTDEKDRKKSTRQAQAHSTPRLKKRAAPFQGSIGKAVAPTYFCGVIRSLSLSGRRQYSLPQLVREVFAAILIDDADSTIEERVYQ